MFHFHYDFAGQVRTDHWKNQRLYWFQGKFCMAKYLQAASMVSKAQ